MVCADIQNVLHAYVDGELDLVRALEVEGHLRDCSVCGEAHDALRVVREALTTEPLRFTAPPGLRERVQRSLRDIDRSTPPRRLPWHRLAVAASLAVIALAGWMLYVLGPLSSKQDRLAREVVANHVRSLMEEHLLDKKSSNRHVVKPWFSVSGRLDFAPPVPNLADHNFALLGGRLDYLDGRTVAALVYGRREHIINLFVWPSRTGAEEGSEHLERQGYNLVHWSQGDMTFWSISDLNAEELEEFALLIQKETLPR
jgi:anti-sigma factor RsiW